MALRILLLIAALVAPCTAASVAWACEPPPCQAPVLLGAGGDVPANAAGLWLRSQGPVRLEFTQEAGGALLMPAEASVQGSLFTPVAPLVVGSGYRVSLQDDCASASFDGRFRVVDAAPSPTRLGRALASEPQPASLALAHAGGACSETLRVHYSEIRLEPDPGFAPWFAVARLETWVDGRRWQPTAALGDSLPLGGSWVGRGRDRVYTTCSDDRLLSEPGLAAGAHRVEFRAYVPGRVEPLRSEAVRVELECPEAGDPYTGEAQTHWLEWAVVVVIAALSLLLFRRRGSRGP